MVNYDILTNVYLKSPNGKMKSSVDKNASYSDECQTKKALSMLKECYGFFML